MKVTVKHYLCMRFDTTYMSEPEFGYYPFNPGSNENYTVIQEVDFELVIPDNFDPKAGVIESLKKQKQRAMADHQRLMDTIDGKIQQLLCIEHKVESDHV